jgi:hypothetical protein
MAQSARNASIGVNGFDLSGYFRAFDTAWEIGLEDTTTFSATRVAKSWTLLLEEAMWTLTGFWDATAIVGVHAVIKAALALATKSIVTVWPTGDAVGSRGKALQADLSSRTVEGAVDSVLTIGAEFKSSVGEEDVVSHHALAQETIDGNGTTVDNGAATTNGGVAYLEVSAVTTNVLVTVRHSTDNFGANDVLLGTFALATARGAQRLEIAGTINRYTRFVWDLTGNTTFRGSLGRK